MSEAENNRDTEALSLEDEMHGQDEAMHANTEQESDDIDVVKPLSLDELVPRSWKRWE